MIGFGVRPLSQLLGSNSNTSSPPPGPSNLVAGHQSQKEITVKSEWSATFTNMIGGESFKLLLSGTLDLQWRFRGTIKVLRQWKTVLHGTLKTKWFKTISLSLKYVTSGHLGKPERWAEVVVQGKCERLLVMNVHMVHKVSRTKLILVFNAFSSRKRQLKRPALSQMVCDHSLVKSVEMRF